MPWARLLKAAAHGALITATRPLLEDVTEHRWIAALGLRVTQQAVPVTTVAQVLAVLRLHQPRLERELGVVIRDAALRAAACLSVSLDENMTEETENANLPAHPGRALALIEGAATRLQLWRGAGCAQLLALRDQLEDRRRFCLVQGAREQVREADQHLRQLGVEFAAYEADWMERRASADEMVIDRSAVIEERLRQEGLPLSSSVRRGKIRLVEY
ncbi:hypothetical protein [Mangrovitalea sediminis]|uniref:hypothetical protein n=1 Tax=Mangrovitalea sediminis TaxID=1982043 RepID=UPI001177D947|nr:hypothetical protein [Mangrovitalea sediminis]